MCIFISIPSLQLYSLRFQSANFLQVLKLLSCNTSSTNLFLSPPSLQSCNLTFSSVLLYSYSSIHHSFFLYLIYLLFLPSSTRFTSSISFTTGHSSVTYLNSTALSSSSALAMLLVIIWLIYTSSTSTMDLYPHCISSHTSSISFSDCGLLQCNIWTSLSARSCLTEPLRARKEQSLNYKETDNVSGTKSRTFSYGSSLLPQEEAGSSEKSIHDVNFCKDKAFLRNLDECLKRTANIGNWKNADRWEVSGCKL